LSGLRITALISFGLALAIIALAGCGYNGGPASSTPQSLPLASKSALYAENLIRAKQVFADLLAGRLPPDPDVYHPKITKHHTMILRDGTEAVLPNDMWSSFPASGSACATPPPWKGKVPPDKDGDGPFRRVYSTPGWVGAQGIVVGDGGSFQSSETGYAYISGWPGVGSPNNSEVGVQYNTGKQNYSFYEAVPGQFVVGTTRWPPGDTLQIFIAADWSGSGSCASGCVAGTVYDLTCSPSGKCYDAANLPSNGWDSSNCCLFSRMTTIAQRQCNDFTDGSMFGPVAWSATYMAPGSGTPFATAGYQRWPKDKTKIIVDFVNPQTETDSIDLHP
jgi:hypothetical protein